VLAYAAHVALALALLQALSAERGARRDERLISAIAIVGRSAIVTLIAHLSMTGAGWSATRTAAVVGSLAALMGGQVWLMVRFGPAAPRGRRWRVPQEAVSELSLVSGQPATGAAVEIERVAGQVGSLV
jgi:hypothetical protein